MKKLTARGFQAFSLFLLLTCVVGPALAQEVTGSIRGEVLDPSGAGVPSARVTASQAETGLARTAVTDRHGAYVLVLLPLGHYRLEVSALGFRKFYRKALRSASMRLPTFQFA